MFSNDNFGVGLVSIGSIIRTTDAGNNWDEINVVTDENFTSCFALTNTEVFVGRNRFSNPLMEETASQNWDRIK